MNTFLAAKEVAGNEINEAFDKIMDEANTDYQIIPISYWRSRGVMPINRF
jgi:hypothetical protein